MTQRVETIGDATLYLGLAVVVLGVGRPRHNFQILNPVVGLVAVLVVDDLVATKRPSKVALHHNAMFATAGVRPVPFRSQRDVAVGVVRLAPPEMPVSLAAFAYGFALQAAAAFRDALAQRPSIDGLFYAAVTSALPVMQPPALSGVSDNFKPPISVPGQVGDLIGAAVL